MTILRSKGQKKNKNQILGTRFYPNRLNSIHLKKVFTPVLFNHIPQKITNKHPKNKHQKQYLKKLRKTPKARLKENSENPNRNKIRKPKQTTEKKKYKRKNGHWIVTPPLFVTLCAEGNIARMAGSTAAAVRVL